MLRRQLLRLHCPRLLVNWEVDLDTAGSGGSYLHPKDCSIKVIDLLFLHALVPTCWPQPGVLSILLFLSISLIILQSFTIVWEIIGPDRSETHTVHFYWLLFSTSLLYWLSKVELISVSGKARICTKRCGSKYGTALFHFLS